MSTQAVSWGRHPHHPPASEQWLSDRQRPLPNSERPMLPFGNGRSYGDSCLNEGGMLLRTRRLDRLIEFDPCTGTLRCEAGCTLDELLRLIVPAGWFLPVTPGTRYVTVGGSIANDVHGKNHHRAGSFGHHLRSFELLRSDGSRLRCAPDEHAELFSASIGGLGLTGLITCAEIQLARLPSPWLTVETTRFHNLEEFFALSSLSDQRHAYNVAWIDCLAPLGRRGRGLFSGASPCSGLVDGPPRPKRSLHVPFTPPLPVLGGPGMRTFNRCWYHLPRRRHAITHYQPYFYPLDGISDWNRLYGPRGFVQHQCVVPPAVAEAAIASLLDTIADSGTGSFLAVLKRFGDLPGRGMLSFPRPGTTLALDFPFRGDPTLRLLARLNTIVAEAGGAVYPAKDAHMGGRHFRQFFPASSEFENYMDPAFSSSFWRRIHDTDGA